MAGWKQEQDISSAALPELLRRLADALEGKAADGLEGLPREFPREPWRKLVLVAERDGAACRVRLKAKAARDVLVGWKEAPQALAEPGRKAAVDPRARDKYRQLKKALQADYKALQAAARQGVPPRPEVLESFLSLAELMAGDESASADPRARAELAQANRVFLDECRSLRQAASGRDAQALAAALERLERRKAACHAQFK